MTIDLIPALAILASLATIVSLIIALQNQKVRKVVDDAKKDERASTMKDDIDALFGRVRELEDKSHKGDKDQAVLNTKLDAVIQGLDEVKDLLRAHLNEEKRP